MTQIRILRLLVTVLTIGLPMTILGEESGREYVERLDQEKLAAERDAAVALEKAMVAAPEITLFSIDPDSRYDFRLQDTPVIRMPAWEVGAWTITGSTVLKDHTKIAALAESLRENISLNRLEAAECFEPRHAVRFARGKDVVTLLVCFQCLQLDLAGFKEREAIPYLHLAIDDGKAAQTWDRIFNTAGLTIGYDRTQLLSKSATWRSEYPAGFFATEGEEKGGIAKSTPIKGPAIKVRIKGAVRHPGDYWLPSGSSLVDAIVSAGGAFKTKIHGSGYFFGVDNAGPNGQHYQIDAQEGASKLRRLILDNGDEILASEW